MNWEEIKEKYPLVFSKLTNDQEEIINVDEDGLYFYGDHGKQNFEYSIRSLFDFFDNQNVNAHYNSDKTLIIQEPSIGNEYYYTSKGWQNDIEYVFDSSQPLKIEIRTEAESILFEKCFEILENNLSRVIG